MLPPCRCVTVVLPGGVRLTPGAAGALLALARRRGGGKPWDGAVCDAFSAPGGTLLILREVRFSAALAGYALPFLQKYFTE